MEQHAEIFGGQPTTRELARPLGAGAIIRFGLAAKQMLDPFALARQPEITLSPAMLPAYALRTTMRMLAALVASLAFTFTYGTLAAKSRRAEMVLIPLLDVLLYRRPGTGHKVQAFIADNLTGKEGRG